jgi:chemotaxis protein methyltransferase CheR
MAGDLELAPLSSAEFSQFQELILADAGIHLNHSKRALVESRLARRLRGLGFQSYSQYLRLLAGQPAKSPERQQMINCITTNKTDFFRENHHFEFLRDRVIGEARARVARGAVPQLRIWSAACSTGEEPYSIAMTVREAFGQDRSWDIKILASDVDTSVLATAEAGVFEASRFETVPEHLKRRYFLRRKDGDVLMAKDELKSLIRFRHINLIDPGWPIHATFDAIFCRNVIIYFNRPTQERLFERLVRYLGPTGYLLVGHSENLHWMNDLLEPLQNTVYRPRSTVGVT